MHRSFDRPHQRGSCRFCNKAQRGNRTLGRPRPGGGQQNRRSALPHGPHGDNLRPGQTYFAPSHRRKAAHMPDMGALCHGALL